jgi:hypothetical protein
MAKAKTKAKRKAPKKLTKRNKPTELAPLSKATSKKKRQAHSSEPYLNLAAAIMQKPIPEEKTEVSVRDVYHDGQFLPALCFRKHGQPQVPALCGDQISGIRLFHIDVPTHDKSAPTMHGPSGLRAPYPVERFLAHMNKLAADGAPIASDALQQLARALHPFPVARPHAIAAPPDAAERLPATGRRPDAANAPSAAVRSPNGANRTDGKELIRELSRVSGLPPEKVRAKLRASGLRAPYVDPDACRKAMAVPDEPKKPRKKK